MYLIDLLKRQAQVYITKLENAINNAKFKTDIYKAHSSTLSEFYNHAFKPSLDRDKERSFSMDSMNDIMSSIESDVKIAYDELDHVSNKLQETYNTNQDYKTSIKNRIQYLSGIASDLNIMANYSKDTSVVFKDSFTNHDFIDKTFSTGVNATIATSEGIAYLSVNNDKSTAEAISELVVGGNGTAGNYHVVKKVNVETVNPDYNIYAKYQSDEDPHDKEISIVDNEAQTWYEYQKVGFSKSTPRFDIDWANAEKMHDDLTLRVTIKFKGNTEMNWINITPYVPERSRSPITVHSIKVSDDGSNFKSIYIDKDNINSTINLVNQRYLKDNIFETDTTAKFASQGVFNFPKLIAQHVEIILKQDKPYDELIGHTYYQEINTDGEGIKTTRIIPQQEVPVDIIAGPVGRYVLDTNKTIVKNIEVIEGWRYCIGIRGIDIYNKSFEKRSEVISKRFKTAQPIKKILLYANEIIPDEYTKYGLSKRNDWVKYYISINDTEWFPISPMHHNQVGTLAIPPKIYEVNSIASAEEKSNALNKAFIASDKDVYDIRLKVILSRPDDLPGTTPILEEYGLKCIFEGGV